MLENPYQSSGSTLQPAQQRSASLDALASGQKLVIYAALSYIAAAFLGSVLGPAAWLLILLMLVLGGMGLFRISGGLNHPLWLRVLLILLTLLPLVGLLVLLVMSNRATGRLRDAGYSVGLLGVRDY